MTRKNSLFIVAFLSLLVVACTKEKSLDPDDSVENPLLGNWKFVSLHVTGETINEVSQGGFNIKSISNFEYTTKNNTGTVTITADKMNYVDLSYSIDTIFKSYYYEDNVLIDSFDFPLAYALPTTSASTPYKFVPADSVYFPGGSPMNVGGSTVTTTSAGARFRIENNQLIMTTPFFERRTETSQGIPQNVTARGVSVSTLQKQ